MSKNSKNLVGRPTLGQKIAKRKAEKENEAEREAEKSKFEADAYEFRQKHNLYKVKGGKLGAGAKIVFGSDSKANQEKYKAFVAKEKKGKNAKHFNSRGEKSHQWWEETKKIFNKDVNAVHYKGLLELIEWGEDQDQLANWANVGGATLEDEKVLKDSDFKTDAITILAAFADCKERVHAYIGKFVKQGPYRCAMGYVGLYYQETTKTHKKFHFQTEGTNIMTMTQIERKYDIFGAILAQINENMQKKGSGWVLKRVVELGVKTLKMKSKRGKRGIDVNLPRDIDGCINIRNEDFRCFLWCLIYHQSKKEKNSERISSLKKIENKYNMEGLTYPISFEQIDLFEINNPTISVSVLEFVNGELWKTRDQTNYGCETHMTLLLYEHHYVYVNNLSALMRSSKLNKHHTSCPFCLESVTKAQYKTHVQFCQIQEQEGIKEKMQSLVRYPEKGEYIKFGKNIFQYSKQIRQPYIIVADLECFNKLVNEPMSENMERVAEQTANSYGFKVCCIDKKKSGKIHVKRCENAPKKILDELLKQAYKCQEDMQKVAPMIISPKQEKEFQAATHCYLCEKPFEGKQKDRDHDHFLGPYRGPAHHHCNLNFKLNKDGSVTEKKVAKIPVLFHGLKNYDSHLLIKTFEKFSNQKIDVVPSSSSERFTSFTLGPLKFIDSNQFLSASLEELAVRMETKDLEAFHYTKEHFGELAYLMIKKGFYPYDWVNGWECFEQGFPSQDKFYNRITKKGISDEDYKKAENVYKTFNCKNFGDYHDLYLKTDVLLLADIFENFREKMYKDFKLDPVHYFSLPGYSEDCMMKMTKAVLELINDRETHLFCERWQRGGFCMIGCKRVAKANNKHCKDYNPEEPTSHIVYLDCNGMYTVPMCGYLPKGGLKFKEGITLEEIMNHPIEDDIGFAIECDIRFPKKIHRKLRMFVPAPENANFQEEYSDYQNGILQHNGTKADGKKLIAHLHNRKDYIMHYRNLQQIVNLGAKVTIKRVLQFDQSPWMKPYIDFCTEKRTECSKSNDTFGVELYKMMMNSVFGRTMMNVTKQNTQIKITSKKEEFQKWSQRQNFSMSTSQELTGEGYLGIAFMQKKVVDYNRPMYVGCAILDISKTILSEFHYDHIMKNYPTAELLYTDTDSLIYRIFVEDWNAELVKHKDEWFDLSNFYDKKIKDTTNEKKPGYFKPENMGIPITQGIFLNPKCYSQEFSSEILDQVNLEIIEHNGKQIFDRDKKKVLTLESNKAKGIQKGVAKNITLSQYKDVVDTGISKREYDVTSIRSFHHKLQVIAEDKTSLTAFYDKAYCPDNINCYPFGYRGSM